MQKSPTEFCKNPTQPRLFLQNRVWQRDDVEVRTTFLALPNDRALFLEVHLFPKAPLKSLVLRIVAYPAAYTTKGERCVVTALKGIVQVNAAQLSPKDEWWMLFQDKKFEKALGHEISGCGMLFLPEEIESAKVDVQSYPIIAEFASKPSLSAVRICLFDLYDMTNEEAVKFMRANAQRYAELLRSMDFSCRRLRKEVWAKLRATVMEFLPYAKGNPKLQQQVSAIVKETDEAYERLAELVAKGQPPKVEIEDKILANLERLEALIWELKFERLFGEDAGS